jgi:putative ABC transport system ATP-binding protein
MQAAISVRDVTKVYVEGARKIPVLHGVDFDVEQGEVVMLMGPSGSGKTTLLSILGCILRATSGSVQVAGREVAALSERQLPKIRLQHIGFVFQGFNLFPTLTVGENVELALDLKRIRGDRAKRQACKLLEQVGLAMKYDAFPSDISGGQKQRVAIARALAGSPRVILADEPTAALDSVSGRNVMEMMRELAYKHGRGVVAVTHDSRLSEFADRIVHMEDGRIVEAENENTRRKGSAEALSVGLPLAAGNGTGIADLPSGATR